MEQYSLSVKIGSRRTTFVKGWQIGFWIIIFAAAYMVRDLMKVSVPDIVFTGICAAAFMLLDLESTLAMYLFTMVLTVPNFEIRLVYLCIMLGKFVLQKRRLNLVMLIAALTLVALELVNVILFSKKSLYRMLWDFGDVAMYILLPLFWMGMQFSQKVCSRAMLGYVVGSLFGGVVLLLLSGNAVGWDVLLENENLRLGSLNLSGRVDSEGMVTSYNPNQLAIMQTVSASLVFLLMHKKELPKLIGIIMLVPMAAIVLFTKSRTGTLMFVALMAVYFLYIVLSRKRFFLGLAVAAGAVLLFTVLQIYFPVAMQGLLGRFSGQKDITNGRGDLFVQYMNAWTDDPWCFFFGYGKVSFYDVVDIWQSPHNILTDILISYGLVGLISICTQWWLLIWCSFRKIPKQMRFFAFLPAILALIVDIAGQYITTGYPHVRLCALLLLAALFAETPAEDPVERSVV